MTRRRVLSRTLVAAFGLVSAAAMLGATSDAQAAFKMKLSSGATTVIIADGGAGDINPLAGAITFLGPVGAWSMNVTTGSSEPVTNPPYPHMDLASVNATSIGGGTTTLTMMLTDTDFTSSGSLARFATAWSVSPGGSSQLRAYVNMDNLEFSTAGTKVADFGPVGSGAFAFETFSPAAVDALYSVTLVWTITHKGLALTSGNAGIQVPEPGSLALFGLGLVGLGFLWRRRSRHEPIA